MVGKYKPYLLHLAHLHLMKGRENNDRELDLDNKWLKEIENVKPEEEQDLESLLKMIDSFMRDRDFEDVDYESYAQRIGEFKEYISGRWEAEGEDNKEKADLKLALCKFFFRAQKFEDNDLIDLFPLQKEEFNCFRGVSERLDIIDVIKDPLMQVLQIAQDKVLISFMNLYRGRINLGNEVHVFHLVKEVVKGVHQVEFAFEISSYHLNQILCSYVEDFYQKLRPHIEEDHTSYLKDLAIKLAQDEKFLQDLVSDKGIEIDEDGIFLKGFEGEEHIQKKADFEKEFIKRIKQDLPILNSTSSEEFSVFTFEGGDFLKVNYSGLNELLEKNELMTTVRGGIKSACEAVIQLTEVSLIDEEGGAKYSYQASLDPSALGARLLSENPFEMLDALREIYSFSKPGISSLIFYAFHKDAVAAAKKLNEKFQEKKSDLFYKSNQFMLAEYLARYENKAPSMERIKSLCEQDVIKLENLKDEELPFVVLNLPNQKAKEILKSLNEERARKLLSMEALAGFGTGVSCYAKDDLFKSFLSRPDFNELFSLMLDKANQEPEQKAETLLEFIIFENNHYVKIEDTSFIKSVIEKFSKEVKELMLVKIAMVHETKFLEFLLEDEGLDLNAKDSDGNTALLVAAKYGCVRVAQLLLKKKADINLQNLHLDSPLIMAAHCRNAKIVELLLNCEGLDINAENKDGHTALVRALCSEDKKIIRLLLARKEIKLDFKELNLSQVLLRMSNIGHVASIKLLLTKNEINVNIQDDDGDTPLILAAYCGFKEAAELLLAANEIDINVKNLEGHSALSYALLRENAAIVELLLKCHDISLDFDDMDMINKLLIFAAAGGHKEKLQLLLDKGADANAKNSNGDTALNLAIFNNCEEIVKLLLEKEINVNERSSNGYSALILAATINDSKIAKLLLSHKDIDVNSQDLNGNTALMLVAECNNEEMVKLLLSCKELDVNAKNLKGRDALSFAAYRCPEVAKLLLSHKDIDVNSQDLNKNTALILAVKFRNVELVELLLAREELDVNIKNSKNRSALNFAVVNGSVEMVELLLSHKDIDVNSQDFEGDTALIMAVECLDEEVIKLLLTRKDLDLNIKNSNGDNALTKALLSDNSELAVGVIKSLLDRGAAEINCENIDLDERIKNENNPEIQSLLIRVKELQTPSTMFAAEDAEQLSDANLRAAEM